MRNLFLLVSVFLFSIVAKGQLVSDEALAAQYYQSGDVDKALALYQKLFNKTKDPVFYDPYFTCLLRTKKYAAAEQLAKRQFKNNPTNNIYAVDLGRVYEEQGEPTKVSEWYTKLIKQLPKNEFAIKSLASAFYKVGAYEYAIKTFLEGRDLLKNENAFSSDLIDLYRFRKEKGMLTQEYLNALAINPAILEQTESTLASVFEDKQDYDALKTTLLKRLQKDPQNVVFTELLTWQFVQQKDFAMALKQTLALDKRLNEQGDRVYDLSKLLVDNGAYDQAIEALNYLVLKGPSAKFYIQSKIDLLDIKTKLATTGMYSTADLLVLEKDYQALLQELGKSSETAFATRQLAKLQAYYLHKPNEAKIALEGLLNTPGLTLSAIGQIKLELGDVYVVADEIWDAALLYGQVEKQFPNEFLGQEAKARNAKLAYYRGDFAWAKIQLDVLKGATSQLMANDALNLSLLMSDNLQNESDTSALKKYAYADLLIFKNLSEQALVVLDSINILYPKNSLADDILMAKAKIYIAKNDYSEAIAQLQKIVTDYPTGLWADDATFMMADMYETKLSQSDKAKELYQKIITDFPGSLYIIEARKRFRSLRGDKI